MSMISAFAGRYHSLIAQREPQPAELDVSAWTEEGEIMRVRHGRSLLERFLQPGGST